MNEELKSEAYYDGCLARHDELKLVSNPYRHDDPRSLEWRQGWLDTDTKLNNN